MYAFGENQLQPLTTTCSHAEGQRTIIMEIMSTRYYPIQLRSVGKEALFMNSQDQWICQKGILVIKTSHKTSHFIQSQNLQREKFRPHFGTGVNAASSLLSCWHFSRWRYQSFVSLRQSNEGLKEGKDSLFRDEVRRKWRWLGASSATLQKKRCVKLGFAGLSLLGEGTPIKVMPI